LFDYDGQEGDLSFKEGDVITIMKQEEDSEWWEGLFNGTHGMFPANYVEVREPTTKTTIIQTTSTLVHETTTTPGPVEHFAQVSTIGLFSLKKTSPVLLNPIQIGPFGGSQ